MAHPVTSSLAVAMLCPGASKDVVTAGDVCGGLYPRHVELYTDVRGHYKVGPDTSRRRCCCCYVDRV